MTIRAEFHDFDRRTFLRRAGSAAAAGAILPLLESVPSAAHAATDDPDQLFKGGRFAAAERGYRRLLRSDPGNVHAWAQIGYIALLANRFGDAERHLSKALALRPGDLASAQRLAECFVRQDRLARAIPLLKGIDRPRDQALAKLYSHISGTPWQIHGAQSARVPFFTLDPVPGVEAVVNGGTPKRFWLDTYATLDLSQEVAEEAGVRALASWRGGHANNQTLTIWVGVLDSFKIGNIEIRNLPVQWSNVTRPPLPDGSPAAGAFGTTIFYHFLTTMDYAGRALILRRKESTPPPARHGDRLPLWLAEDHFPCTLGSLGDYGPRMVTVDTGGIASGIETTLEIAKKAGLKVDYDDPIEQNGNKRYRVTAERISLGRTVRRNIRGYAFEKVVPGMPGPGQSAQFGFDLIANFTHEFFGPLAITFDYAAMRLSVTRG
ncbi:tetratricopeptide repeat protein [Nonomuraea dietziae]|uniref:tetratricopeptide repeat protein n=1 Tax=Nonomuraea dietziae TaxID=65515 RepID=UPI003407816B